MDERFLFRNDLIQTRFHLRGKIEHRFFIDLVRQIGTHDVRCRGKVFMVEQSDDHYRKKDIQHGVQRAAPAAEQTAHF